ncbi:MAG: heat-inducible transcriptional repressor HrcA [Oscillospiraceae bacterium]
MAMDDRKQRILTAIVSLYSTNAEPIGSNLLSQYFDLAVSSATLRNEMAALTRLGLLEQPHTSAGRVPTAKGYRYYIDNLLGTSSGISRAEMQRIDRMFLELDHDPEKLAQGAAKAFADLLQCAVVTTTPRAEDMRIAHFDVLQVGRYTAAVLAVTNAGGVRTRVAKVDFEFSKEDAGRAAQILNRFLRFVAEADVSAGTVRNMVDAFGEGGNRYWPVLSAALTLLAEVGTPSVYVEGQKYFLLWPELEENLHALMEFFNEPTQLENLVYPQSGRVAVLLGEEFAKPIPGLCLLTSRYLAGGGLTGAIAVAGPARMSFCEVIPQLEYFGGLLGKAMSGSAA